MQVVKELHHFLQHNSYRRVFPILERTFSLMSSRMYVEHLYVAKHVPAGSKVRPKKGIGASQSQSSLQPYVDESEFSFIVVLNDDFEGGGIRFAHNGQMLRLPAGSLLTFSSTNQHEVLPVTKGTQYMVTGFVRYGGRVLEQARTV